VYFICSLKYLRIQPAQSDIIQSSSTNFTDFILDESLGFIELSHFLFYSLMIENEN